MIQSFKNKLAKDLFEGNITKETRRFPKPLQYKAELLLEILDTARQATDMPTLPGNALEKLKGDLKSYYSVRINDQWRLVFRFENGHAFDVQIMDYHH